MLLLSATVSGVGSHQRGGRQEADLESGVPRKHLGAPEKGARDVGQQEPRPKGPLEPFHSGSYVNAMMFLMLLLLQL